MIAFDANVLVHAVDSALGSHHETTLRLLERAARNGDGIVPTQALGEFYHVARRKIGLSSTDAWSYVQDWLEVFRTIDYGASDLPAAHAAHRDHGLPFWDALIWAVCERAGAEILITQDFQNGRRLGRVAFLDPFAPANTGRLGLA